MADSVLQPEKFGFFSSSSKSKGVVADASPRTACSLLGPVFSKKLAQISEREGEDAVLTGGTRSLSRRLLALNIAEVHSQPSPALHSPQTRSA